MSTATLAPAGAARCPNRHDEDTRDGCADCEAQAALEATAAGELLTRAYGLTHDLHRLDGLAKTRGYPDRAGARDQAASVRAMRDLITAELLRRAGEQA